MNFSIHNHFFLGKNIHPWPKEKSAAGASDTLKSCGKCFAKLAPGQPHDCRPGARVSNILSWMPADVAQQVSSKVVTEAAGDSPNVSLKRVKGPQLTVNLGKAPEKTRQLTHQVIDLTLDKSCNH